MSAARRNQLNFFPQTVCFLSFAFLALAASTAKATDPSRVRTLSLRPLIAKGTRAPSTTPQLAAPAMYSNSLAKRLPDSRSGASKMSASTTLIKM